MIKRLLGYIAFIVVVILMALFFENYELLFLAAFLGVLPLINAIIINITIKCIEIEHYSTCSVINKSEYIPIIVRINNRSFLPVILLELQFMCTNYYHDISKDILFALPILKYGRQECMFYIKSDYCGDIKIELEKIKCLDYFNLYYKMKEIKEHIKVYALPNIGNIDGMEISKKTMVDIDGEKFSEITKGDDPSQVFDYREYRPGDKLHSIHWKLTSRKKNIMVKEYSLPLNGNYSVIMDLSCRNNKEKELLIDAITETTFSVILKLQDEGINHYLIGADRSGTICYKDIINHDMELSETMFELYKSKYQEHVEVLDLYEKSEIECNEGQIYYITSCITKKCLIKLYELYNKAHIKILCIAKENEEVMDMVNEALMLNIDVEIVDYDNTLEDISQVVL